MPFRFSGSVVRAAGFALSVVLAAPADAAVTGYTDFDAFVAATGTLTTDGFEDSPPWANPLSEPVQSQGASYQAAQSLEVDAGGGRGASNGVTDQDSVPQALDTISIDLPAGAIAAGGWLETFGPFQGDDIVLTAYDGADQVMGSVTLPTEPSSGHRFVGLVSDQPIARVVFQSLGAGGLENDDFVLDDLSFEITASVPLLAPWQLALLGAVLILLATKATSSPTTSGGISSSSERASPGSPSPPRTSRT